MAPNLVDPNWYSAYWYGEQTERQLRPSSALRWVALTASVLLGIVVLRA